MNSVMTLTLVVLFPVACLLALMGLSWLEDSLTRGLETEAKDSRQAVVEMPVRRAEPAVVDMPVRALETAPVPQQRRLRPSRAAS